MLTICYVWVRQMLVHSKCVWMCIFAVCFFFIRLRISLSLSKFSQIQDDKQTKRTTKFTNGLNEYLIVDPKKTSTTTTYNWVLLNIDILVTMQHWKMPNCQLFSSISFPNCGFSSWCMCFCAFYEMQSFLNDNNRYTNLNPQKLCHTENVWCLNSV